MELVDWEFPSWTASLVCGGNGGTDFAPKPVEVRFDGGALLGKRLTASIGLRPLPGLPGPWRSTQYFPGDENDGKFVAIPTTASGLPPMALMM